ncbi:hypothetical protein HELRODRAFT_162947 [Helobdella robusta]|uniref:Uncharacterized protein n=1 Tax=Helobdella robusta TaxID=6412 RepID=T1ETE5_HELRO|nr:hypothetical protein HELRODRAFT_162947 [Helobdella robusta]ESN99400.1 hypothetical protein HELRODRAFT_162947 [Helobdella robusta]
MKSLTLRCGATKNSSLEVTSIYSTIIPSFKRVYTLNSGPTHQGHTFPHIILEWLLLLHQLTQHRETTPQAFTNSKRGSKAMWDQVNKFIDFDKSFNTSTSQQIDANTVNTNCFHVNRPVLQNSTNKSNNSQ